MATAQLGTKAIGDIIRIKEDGVLQDFYVAKQQPTDKLTLLVRRFVKHRGQWHSYNNDQAYGGSTIDEWHEKIYYNKIQEDVRALIPTTDIGIEYTPDYSNSTIRATKTYTRKVFAADAGRDTANHIPASLVTTQAQDGGHADYWVANWRADSKEHDGCVFYVDGNYAVWVPKTHTYCYRPLFFLPSTLLIDDNGEPVCNQAPTAPQNFTVPTQVYSAQSVHITWDESTDPDDDEVNYELERSANGEDFTQIYSGTALPYNDTLSTTIDTVQYRVRAVDSQSLASDWTVADERGVIHNQPPKISGTDGDLGTFYEGVRYDYTVTDPENDAVTVVEQVGTAVIRSHSPTLGELQTATVDGHFWAGLPLGEHTLPLTATDRAGGSTVRTMTFTKWVDHIFVSLTEPLEAVAMPTRINIDVVATVSAGATLKVETCNNGYDPSPTWEDATLATLANLAHVYQNTAKQATKFGVNFRVRIDRNAAIGDCHITGIGGNFE